MYVYWKALIFFGVTFWILNCLTDYCRPDREYEFEKIIFEPEIPIEQGTSFETIFLRTVAIVLSFVLLVIAIRVGFQKITLVFNRHWLNVIEMPIKRADRGKIAKIKKEDANVTDSSASSKSTLKSKKEKLSRGKSNKHLEKLCSKLQEEITVMRSSSSQELKSLSDKVYNMSREKRHLHVQLQQALKENRAAKFELEEVLKDRTELIKRLESATKEVKANTKSKKNILAKLEEAVNSMERLKLKFDQVSRDKEILEDKLNVLEVEYKNLKRQMVVTNINEDIPKNEDREHAVDRQDCGDFNVDFMTAEKVEDYDITQSEKNMKKVQEKLLNLEKSLEKLKISDINTMCSEEFESKWNSYSCYDEGMLPEHEQEELENTEKPSLNSICTEPDCQLDHQECSNTECLLRYTECDDELPEDFLNRTILHQANSEINSFNHIDLENVYQRSKSTEDRLSIITEQTSPPASGIDEEEDWEEQSSDYGKSRVSSHPLFLEFVANNLVQEV